MWDRTEATASMSVAWGKHYDNICDTVDLPLYFTCVKTNGT